MRRVWLVSIVVLVLATAMAVSGCSSALTSATERYNQALAVAVELRDAGVIDDDAYVRIDLARSAAAVALDAWGAAESLDDKETARRVFRAALVEFVGAVQEVRRESSGGDQDGGGDDQAGSVSVLPGDSDEGGGGSGRSAEAGGTGGRAEDAGSPVDRSGPG